MSVECDHVNFLDTITDLKQTPREPQRRRLSYSKIFLGGIQQKKIIQHCLRSIDRVRSLICREDWIEHPMFRK